MRVLADTAVDVPDARNAQHVRQTAAPMRTVFPVYFLLGILLTLAIFSCTLGLVHDT
jgi:hypothetical protein